MQSVRGPIGYHRSIPTFWTPLPVTHIEDLIVPGNPFSVYWDHRGKQEAEHQSKDPVVRYGRKVLIYVMGMVGYAFSIVSRIVRLVMDLFMILLSAFCFLVTLGAEWARCKCWSYLTRAVENTIYIPVAFVGIICPPLAYRLDDKIFILFLSKSSENYWRKPYLRPELPESLQYPEKPKANTWMYL